MTASRTGSVSSGPPLLEARTLSFAYPRQREIFRNISLALRKGERRSLRGSNGAGKTTLLHLLVGLLRPAEGEILFDGAPVTDRQDLARLRASVGLLFQDPDDMLFCPSLLEDVAFGPLNLGVPREEAHRRSLDVLERLGLTHLASRPPYTLSGGEKRLGALAALLSMEPKVLLLDEPTGGLDERAWGVLVEELSRNSAALLVASHDEEFLAAVAPEGFLLREGTLTSFSPEESLREHHPATTQQRPRRFAS
jgi:cobalt/nickel transport system ATP-binding protein